MSDFQALRNKVIIGSFFGTGLGALLLLTPAKPLSTWIVAGSLGFLGATQLITDEIEKVHTKKANKFLSDIEKLKHDIDFERKAIASKTNQLKDKNIELENQSITLNQLTQEINKFQVIIHTLKGELLAAKNQISELKDVSANEAIEILTDSYTEFQNSVIALTEFLAKKFPNLNKYWDTVNFDYSNYAKELLSKIRVVSDQSEKNEIITMSLAVQHEILHRGNLLKIKAYKSVINHLTQLVKNSIALDSHNKTVEQLNESWQAKNQAIAQTYQKNFQAIKQEFSQVADSVVDGYHSDFKEIIDEGLSQAEQIEALQIEITRLQHIVSEISKPHRFPGLVEQARVGNAIIDYYARAGYVLDAIDWQDSENGYTLLLHIGRNGSRFISADELNANDAPEKLKEVSGAINTPEFKFNNRGGHIVLEIQTRRAPKKPVDISKLAKSAEQFPTIVSKWRRVRITGGSEAGKSPTAENLAVSILNVIQGQKVIKFIDPMHDSGKNYRSIPACGTSHQDSADGLREMEEELTKRSQGSSRDIFYLAWFDEIDTTLNKFDVSNELLNIIKQASHQNMGIIVTGQNANTRKFKGFDKSDFNNMVGVHIGDDYLNVLANRLSDHPNKAELLERGNKLTQWCVEQNEEYGLPKDDPEAYRFALVVEPGKLPYYIFLPAFGAYQYKPETNDGLSTNTQKMLFSNNMNGSVETAVKAVLEVNVHCPHCNSTNINKNGKSRKNEQLYSCKDCNVKPVKWMA